MKTVNENKNDFNNNVRGKVLSTVWHETPGEKVDKNNFKNKLAQHSTTSLEASADNIWDLRPNEKNFKIKMFKNPIKVFRLAD